MATNAFGDMTSEGFRKVMNGLQNQKHKKRKSVPQPLFAEIPPTVDWGKERYVTPGKDQGHCSSCWAFSATGALEGQMFPKAGERISLSEDPAACSQFQATEAAWWPAGQCVPAG